MSKLYTDVSYLNLLMLIVRLNAFQVNGWITRFQKWFQSGDEFSVFGSSKGLIRVKRKTGMGRDTKMHADEIFRGEINLLWCQRFYLIPMRKMMPDTDPLLIDFDSLMDIADAARRKNACGE
jgi:hypothetical protein